MPLRGEKNDVCSFSQSPLTGSLSNLQVLNEDKHKSTNEFKFWPDRIFHFGVIRP